MLEKIGKTFLIYIFCTISILAQNISDPNKIVMNRIYVQYSDSIVETHYYSGEKKIKEKDNLVYYWYAANDIKQTQGAYEGKILHGACVMFYNNKDLLSKGSFKYGIKTGVWKYWYKGGKLKSKEIWKNGILSGVKMSYNKNGTVQTKATYKKGILHGWTYHYDSNGLLKEKELFEKDKSSKKIIYTINSKDKAVPEKKNKDKKAENESESKKGFFKKKPKSEDGKAPKIKKEKKNKIKIQRYHEVQPGGQGA